MTAATDLCAHVRGLLATPLAAWRHTPPWELVAQAPQVVQGLLAALAAGDYAIDASGSVAVHHSATVETGAVLKGPLVIGPACFVAAGAYLRGGNWLDAGCTLGPGVELKSSFVFAGTRLAHFNFVGDSVLGGDVNLEAGSIVCNVRNERGGAPVQVVVDGMRQPTGRARFGALIGDGCRIGANAVLAPGTLLAPATVFGRGQLVDQDS